MNRSRTRSAVALAALSLAAAACSRDKAPANDSELQNDLSLASQQTAATPTFQDTALAPTPSPSGAERAPAPKPQRASSAAPRREAPRRVAERPQPVERREPAQTPAPAPASTPSVAQVGAGTGLGMSIGSRVCTSTARPGDKVVATLDAPVNGTHGAMIPAGATVVLEVASVDGSGDPANANITFRIRAIDVNDHTYTAHGDATAVSGMQRSKVAGDPNADKKKVIGGAIAGAVLGQIFGHSTKATVIGAAAGGAAGAVAAKAGEKYESCLPAGASLRGVLSDAMVM